jgi:hypothetical protein
VLATGSVYLVGDLLAHARDLGLRAGLGADDPLEGEHPAREVERKGGAS